MFRAERTRRVSPFHEVLKSAWDNDAGSSGWVVHTLHTLVRQRENLSRRAEDSEGFQATRRLELFIDEAAPILGLLKAVEAPNFNEVFERLLNDPVFVLNLPYAYGGSFSAIKPMMLALGLEATWYDNKHDSEWIELAECIESYRETLNRTLYASFMIQQAKESIVSVVPSFRKDLEMILERSIFFLGEREAHPQMDAYAFQDGYHQFGLYLAKFLYPESNFPEANDRWMIDFISTVHELAHALVRQYLFGTQSTTEFKNDELNLYRVLTEGVAILLEQRLIQEKHIRFQQKNEETDEFTNRLFQAEEIDQKQHKSEWQFQLQAPYGVGALLWQHLMGKRDLSMLPQYLQVVGTEALTVLESRSTRALLSTPISSDKNSPFQKVMTRLFSILPV